jgi:hypothetical protein
MGATSELRIAMWSGPRNISTAMMRSWGNRPDTVVCDEPLYAHYLQQTGKHHPGSAEVLAHHETDWRAVAAELTGPIPNGKSIYYQKHMTHHLLPAIEREWLDRLTHCFLIREPEAMLASLAAKLDSPALEDTGLPQQVELFERVCARGVTPPVIDSSDVLRDPRGTLELLCAALEIPFTDAMLEWPAGRRETDGIWARHWYESVEASTGFAPPVARTVELSPALSPVLDACRPLYDRLAPHALRGH